MTRFPLESPDNKPGGNAASAANPPATPLVDKLFPEFSFMEQIAGSKLNLPAVESNAQLICDHLSELAKKVLDLKLLTPAKSELIRFILANSLLHPSADTEGWMKTKYNNLLETGINLAFFLERGNSSGLLPILVDEAISKNIDSEELKEYFQKKPAYYSQNDLITLVNFDENADLIASHLTLSESLSGKLQETVHNPLINSKYLAEMVAELIESKANIFIAKSLNLLDTREACMLHENRDLNAVEQSIKALRNQVCVFSKLCTENRDLFKEAASQDVTQNLSTYLERCEEKFKNSGCIEKRQLLIREIGGMIEFLSFGKSFDSDLKGMPED